MSHSSRHRSSGKLGQKRELYHSAPAKRPDRIYALPTVSKRPQCWQATTYLLLPTSRGQCSFLQLPQVPVGGRRAGWRLPCKCSLEKRKGPLSSDEAGCTKQSESKAKLKLKPSKCLKDKGIKNQQMRIICDDSVAMGQQIQTPAEPCPAHGLAHCMTQFDPHGLQRHRCNFPRAMRGHPKQRNLI